MPDPATIADDLLPRCTVRIEVGGVHRGTGFFIGPGLVVTCAHVMESKVLSSTVVEPIIRVIDLDEIAYPVEPLKQLWREDDLAVLKLRKRTDHLSVLLDHGLRAFDKLHIFAYPEGHPEGVPTTLKAEGGTGPARRRYKLTSGQIQPGMSGAPVLNLRTGAVCGILNRTRDQRQDLGGYAIPVTVLLEHDPTLLTKNQRFHEQRTDWCALLTPQQQHYRNLAQNADPSRVTAPTTQFVVSVGEIDDGWQVSADVYPEGRSILPVPVDLNTVRRQVARLLRQWASRGRVQEAEQIRLLGSILYSAVFPLDIGRELVALIQQPHKGRVFVGLRFEEDTDEDLIQLPWEHLYLPTNPGMHLAAEPRLSFARTMAKEPSQDEDSPKSGGLSMLVVAVKPREFGTELRAEDRRASLIQEAVDALDRAARKVDGLEATTLDNPDPDELEQGIGAGSYDIIHYVGFGRFQATTEELALGAETRDGIDYIPIDVFATCLAQAAPRLVMLQLCEAPAGTVPADFAVMGPALLNVPIPAVIAYQYPVIPSAGAKFNEEFYKAVGTGQSVDRAVQEARKKVWYHDRNSRAFISPALFVRHPGEVRLASAAPLLAQDAQQGAYATYG
jgi:CHAT domain/Trypsin-like peptidase domain